jgi:hypothetical protein
MKHAFETHMPDSLVFLLHKVPAHFSKSTIRRKDFLEIQETMEGKSTDDLCHPFNKYSEKQWLARGKVSLNFFLSTQYLVLPRILIF